MKNFFKSRTIQASILGGIFLLAVTMITIIFPSYKNGSPNVVNSPGSINTVGQTGDNAVVNNLALLTEIPTGTIDSANTKFTVSHLPSYIVADGTTYFELNGYSLSKNEVKMDNPPTYFIRSFYKSDLTTTENMELKKTGFEIPSERPDGKLRSFTFVHAPTVIFRDSVPMRKVSSDGTINWTGTSTVVLLDVAPNYDIYAQY